MAARAPSEASTPSVADSNGSPTSPSDNAAASPPAVKRTVTAGRGGKPLLDTLLKKNAQWSHDVSSQDKYFFKTSAMAQAPKVLWIGCCDSRVPETTLVAARPGDIFVHRNIANQFHPHDDSAQAALAYAVGAAGVQHVLVVGHTVCGGCLHAFAAPVEAASDLSTPLSRFLAPLISLRHSLPEESQIEPGEQTLLQDLVEANVQLSVETIAATETVQANWALKGSKGVQIHGLVYHLDTGRLHNLHVSLVPPEDDLETGANRSTQEDKDVGVSALLKDLKIPEHDSRIPESGLAGQIPALAGKGEKGGERMEETPMETGLERS